MNILQINDVTKIYNQGKSNALTALSNICLDIEKEELLAITGKSGSGKSTLLHILGGLDTPTSGEVIHNGKKLNYRDLLSLSSYRNSEVGFVLQDFGLLLRETVFENVSVPLLFSDCPFFKMKERTLNALRLVGIEDLAKQKASQLSGGQKQRTAIARALVNNPNILLCDEPTGSLDSKTGQEIMDLLIQMNRSGKTIIIVTHDEKIARQAARTIYLKDGKIE